MRHAPPVRVVCTSCTWRLVQAAVLAFAAGALAAWAVQHGGTLGTGWPLAAAAVAFLAVGAGALRLLRRPAFELLWDGQQWWLAGQPGSVALKLQAGYWVLVQFRRGDGPAPEQWLAVSRIGAGPAWHRLLVALCAHAKAEAPSSHDWAA